MPHTIDHSAPRHALGLPEGTPRLLADLVQDNVGLSFDADHWDTMLDKLAPLALHHGCRTFLDYYFLLKFEGDQLGEWQTVMDTLSIQETYFWREMEQIRSLVEVLVPQWFEQTREPLRILSAACATGEEPFTIAMVLEEAGWFDRARIEIVAIDASGIALDKARRGIFRERSFRTIPLHLRRKYFQAVPQGMCIDPRMLVRVRFQRANLVIPSEMAPLVAGVPVVFCRNVFIYFSPEGIHRTLRTFAEGMPRGGCLCVGASESMLRLQTAFELTEIGGAFVYRNRLAGTTHAVFSSLDGVTLARPGTGRTVP